VYSGGSLDHTRHFYYSSQWQVLEERIDASTTADRQYVWGVRYVDDLVLRDAFEEQPTSSSSSSSSSGGGSMTRERLYALQGANWNVVAIIDDEGAVVERYRYEAYGLSTVMDASFNFRPVTLYDWEYRYTGQTLDFESQLQLNRYRYYASNLGRWLIRDPIRYRAGFNLYWYVGDRPTQLFDPMGLRECRCDCKGLMPINKEVNAIINKRLAGLIAGTSKKPLDQSIFDAFGTDVAGTGWAPATQIEEMISDLQRSKDGASKVNEGGSFYGTPFQKADCFLIACNGTRICVGTDKLGHFFQQGHMLYEVDRYWDEKGWDGRGVSSKSAMEYAYGFSLWIEGLWGAGRFLQSRPNKRDSIERWLWYGEFDFYGFEENSLREYKDEWGNVPGAPASMQDHHAQIDGMLFYLNIMTTKGKGFTFDICNYARPNWEEPPLKIFGTIPK